MGEKTLRSLEEADSEARRHYNVQPWNQPRPNGIACPGCGSELQDTRSGEMLLSFPPRRAIQCSECDYTGSRIV